MGISATIKAKVTEKIVLLIRPLINKRLAKHFGDLFTFRSLHIASESRLLCIEIDAKGESQPFTIQCSGIILLKEPQNYTLSYDKITTLRPWVEGVIFALLKKRGYSDRIPLPKSWNKTVGLVKHLLPFN